MAYCENCLLHQIGEKCPEKTYFVCKKCIKESGDFLSDPPYYTKLFSEGDTVLITRKEKDFACGWNGMWTSSMNKFIGKTGQVKKIKPKSLLAHIRVTEYNQTWHFPLWVLKKQNDSQLNDMENEMLQDAKVGDRVKCVLNGWGTITNIEQDRKYKIFEVKFDDDRITETVHYHSDGKLNLNHLHPAIIEHVPQKWEPELGIYQITTTGFVVCNTSITTEHKKALKREATTFKTKKQIEIVRDSTRVLRRQFAWLFEHFPEQDGQWSKETMYSVSYDLEEKEYIDSIEDFDAISETTVYMSEEASKMLVKQLNQGAVEL